MVWRRGIFVLVVLFGWNSLSTLQAQPPGAAIFASNCATCHGADGRGGEHAPNIATAPEVQHLMDRELAGIIRYGIAGAGMPAFSSLKQQEVADVVSYLRVLQGRGDIVKLPGDPSQGEVLFFGKAQCSDCHMVNGKGGFIGSDLTYYGAEAKPDQMRAIILDPDKNLPAGQESHYRGDNSRAKRHRDAQDQQQFLPFPADPRRFVPFPSKIRAYQGGCRLPLPDACRYVE